MQINARGKNERTFQGWSQLEGKLRVCNKLLDKMPITTKREAGVLSLTPGIRILTGSRAGVRLGSGDSQDEDQGKPPEVSVRHLIGYTFLARVVFPKTLHAVRIVFSLLAGRLLARRSPFQIP